MTDYHCPRCKTRTRVFTEPYRVRCIVCDRAMLPGRGRHTRPAQRHQVWIVPKDKDRPWQK